MNALKQREQCGGCRALQLRLEDLELRLIRLGIVEDAPQGRPSSLPRLHEPMSRWVREGAEPVSPVWPTLPRERHTRTERIIRHDAAHEKPAPHWPGATILRFPSAETLPMGAFVHTGLVSTVDARALDRVA